MKLVNTGTGQFTRIKTAGGVQAAANRLVARAKHGYFASSIAHIERRILEMPSFDVEIVRSCFGLTEHTGEFLTLRVEC